MQLTVLGANGTYPTAGRPASGYLLRSPSTAIWLDAGPGTFSALQEHIDPLDLDAVVLSHVHLDHCIDVLAFFHFARYGPQVREGIPVLAADLIEERLSAFLEAGPDHPFWATFEFRTVAGGDTATVGDVVLRFADTYHPVPTVAVRVEWRDASLTYTADTGVSAQVEALARDTDVLVAEAAFQGDEKPVDHHLTATEAAALASAAGARRLVLTHISPDLDPNRSLAEAEAVFPRRVRAAIPGTTISI